MWHELRTARGETPQRRELLKGYSISIGARSEKGANPFRNSDRFFTINKPGLVAAGVFDGMGLSGQEAALYASDYFSRGLPAYFFGLGEQRPEIVAQTLSTLTSTLSLEIADRFRGTKAPRTTVTAAYLFDGTNSPLPLAAIPNVGDSRAYRINKVTSRIKQLTLDDSLGNWADKNREEENRNEQARRGNVYEFNPKKRFLDAVLGDTSLEPRIEIAELDEESMLLLVTDGVYGKLMDGQMAEILALAASAQEGADRLVEAAKAKGGILDDMTAVVIDLARAA